MDRQILLAVALSALVVFGYQEYLRIYFPNLGKTPPQETSATPSESPAAPAALPPPVDAPRAAPPKEPGQRPEGNITIDTPLVAANVSPLGGRLTSLRLKRYRTTIDPESPLLDLVALGSDRDLPLGAILRGTTAWSDERLVYEPSATTLTLGTEESGEIVLRGKTPDGAAIEKTLRFKGDTYAFGVALKVIDSSQGYKEAALRWTHRPPPTTSTFFYQGPEALLGGKLLHFDEEELRQGVVLPDPRTAATAPPPPLHWAGYADSYFLSAVAARENDPARLWIKQEQNEIFTEVLIPLATVGAEPYPFTVYAGPKDLHELAKVGRHMQRTVDLGWFSFVAEPMLRLLKIFHRFTGNYGIDVILLTVLVKLVTVPLTHKSFKSMQELQKLQPQMKKLQEKFADDRNALNKEVMELYRRHNVNPLGGCLPMLVQMPIFIGLYNALLSAVELRHAPFMLWMNDLSAPDRLPAIPAPPLGVIAGTEIRIPVVTLLMGVSMLIQQKMAPQAGDPMQQRMMMIMPVVFTVMFINFPSGLALYWLVNNVLTIAQQLWMQRAKA